MYLRGFEQNRAAKSVLADCIVGTNPLTALLTYQYRPRKGIQAYNSGEVDYEFVVFGGLDEKTKVAGEVRKYLAIVILPALRDAETDLQTWKKSPLRPLLDRVRKLIDPEKLKAMALVRDKLGFQLAFHAIGDRANRVALDVFESVVRVNGLRDRRDRIEHAQVVSPQDISRFGELKVIASMQPSHQTNDMRWAEQRVGPERIQGAYAWNSLQKAGAKLAFGTDYPVEPINPFRGLYACVTRESADGGPAGGWQSQEKLPLDDCIRAYTSGSAYAQFEEGKKGELKVGEFADFIVISRDITKAAPKDLLSTQVLQTVVGGRTVYQRK